MRRFNLYYYANILSHRYGISIEDAVDKLKEGASIEKEHTNIEQVAMKIAYDHLMETIDYYLKLKQVGL